MPADFNVLLGADPALNAPRNSTRDLFHVGKTGGVAVFKNLNKVAFVFVGPRIIRKQESAFIVKNITDLSVYGRALDVNVKDRQKNAHHYGIRVIFCFYGKNGAVCRAGDFVISKYSFAFRRGRRMRRNSQSARIKGQARGNQKTKRPQPQPRRLQRI